MRDELPVRWNLRASSDLKNIFDKINKKSPQNARHVVESLVELADSLGYFPEKHPRLLQNLTERNLRSVSKWTYRIIYEVSDDTVKIMKIFDNSENPNKLLENL